jgi:putative ABC transport system permease protein
VSGFVSNFRIALTALVSRRLRTLLTMLGILVGIAAVVMVTALSSGARSAIGGQIQALGSNVIFVFARPASKSGARVAKQGLTERDAHAIRREASAVAGVTVWSSIKAQVVSEFGNASVDVMGVDEHYFSVRDFKVAGGRSWTVNEAQTKAKVCLLGQTTRQNLFGDLDPVGRFVRIGKHPVLVIGTLGAKGQSPWEDQDDRIVMPIDTWRSRISPGLGDRVQMLMAQAKSPERVDAAVQQIDGLLRQRHAILEGEEADYRISSQAQLQASQESIFTVLTTLLLSVAGIALLVGGVGVMNVMLVSVAERTREIGIRMAIGARESDIQIQFLIESTLLALLGGVGGIGVALLGVWSLELWFGWSMLVNWTAVAIALATSTLIGLVFGYLPARRAATLDPIEALRHE